MLIRNMLICVLTGMLCLGFFCPRAANAAQTPQEFVKEFYGWYLSKHYEHKDILEDGKLPEYVDETLIGYLKVKPSSDIYYFIQHGSSTMAFKDCRIVVKDTLKMTDDVFVVPVTFKGEDFERAVIAYVKKVDSGFKIASVSDAYPY